MTRLLTSFLAASLVVTGCIDESTDEVELMPEIQTFLSANPEYGEVLSVGEAPRWAAGPRQAVATNTGSYVFYVHERLGEVVGVWQQTEEGGLRQIWSKEVPEETIGLGERAASEDLPAYEVIDAFETIGGDKYADVLITSISRETPAEERERIARRIASGEGLHGLGLYCSKEAREANYSASFAESNPDALRSCALGQLEGTEFNPYDELY